MKFNDWTNNKIMRAPIFLRIRNDKPPSQCIIETPSIRTPNRIMSKIAKYEDNSDNSKINKSENNTKRGNHLTQLINNFLI